jgi:hypothetical protein
MLGHDDLYTNPGHLFDFKKMVPDVDLLPLPRLCIIPRRPEPRHDGIGRRRPLPQLLRQISRSQVSRSPRQG